MVRSGQAKVASGTSRSSRWGRQGSWSARVSVYGADEQGREFVESAQVGVEWPGGLAGYGRGCRGVGEGISDDGVVAAGAQQDATVGEWPGQ